MTNSSPMGSGGSFTQEGPFELSLKCKKRKKEGYPWRKKQLVQRCEHSQLVWSRGRAEQRLRPECKCPISMQPPSWRQSEQDQKRSQESIPWGPLLVGCGQSQETPGPAFRFRDSSSHQLPTQAQMYLQELVTAFWRQHVQTGPEGAFPEGS